MNERIRELADEAAKFTAISALLSGESANDANELFLEKFVELIIQKCITQISMIGISNFENDDIMWTVETATTSIKEHFGIEP